ncbi:hypothetical protein [Azospirillum sp. B506]|uniref:hypothetical protein n=1 Tax=Azospirillum sp. B506 TaxID=137721 RepID=UPI0003488A53|nr:hypothetical protein [Azospirillum sp. B506]
MDSMSDDGQALPVLSPTDIDTTINHEPRILDLRLAAALGFRKPRDIRPLIERHREALERLGEVCLTVRQTSPNGGRPAAEFWLTKKQAVYLCTKAETERATDITIAVVELFDAVTSGKALPTPAASLTKADLDAIDRRARELGEAEERRVRAALTADALDRVRQGQPVDVAMLLAPPAARPLLPAPAPSLIGTPLSDLPFNERSLILAYRDLPPTRKEQLSGLMGAAATYTESLRGLWTATSACGMWDGIAAMIDSHAHKFHQRIPIG